MNDVIAARRQAIRDAAPCEGCGATLADCVVERGKDPTAPDWFGCCAQGVDMRPCRHVQSRAALAELLDEIESGHVRTVDEATPKPRAKGVSWTEYLDQGEQWKPNGKPMVRIDSMDPTWRLNASRWLVRNAKVFAQKYSLAAMFEFAVICGSPVRPSEMSTDGIEAEMEQEADSRRRDPEAWIRSTALYGALTAGLPAEADDLAALSERAKHWSDCPVRSGGDACRCEEIRAAHQAAEVAS